MRCKKTASASAECRFASVSMMARGGREKASQRLNPESLYSPLRYLGGRFFRFGSKLVPKVIWFYLEISAKKSFKTYKFP